MGTSKTLYKLEPIYHTLFIHNIINKFIHNIVNCFIILPLSLFPTCFFHCEGVNIGLQFWANFHGHIHATLILPLVGRHYCPRLNILYQFFQSINYAILKIHYLFHFVGRYQNLKTGVAWEASLFMSWGTISESPRRGRGEKC